MSRNSTPELMHMLEGIELVINKAEKLPADTVFKMDEYLRCALGTIFETEFRRETYASTYFKNQGLELFGFELYHTLNTNFANLQALKKVVKRIEGDTKASIIFLFAANSFDPKYNNIVPLQVWLEEAKKVRNKIKKKLQKRVNLMRLSEPSL